jgi:hypothetical protein
MPAFTKNVLDASMYITHLLKSPGLIAANGGKWTICWSFPGTKSALVKVYIKCELDGGTVILNGGPAEFRDLNFSIIGFCLVRDIAWAWEYDAEDDGHPGPPFFNL